MGRWNYMETIYEGHNRCRYLSTFDDLNQMLVHIKLPTKLQFSLECRVVWLSYTEDQNFLNFFYKLICSLYIDSVFYWLIDYTIISLLFLIPFISVFISYCFRAAVISILIFLSSVFISFLVYLILIFIYRGQGYALIFSAHSSTKTFWLLKMQLSNGLNASKSIILQLITQ